jgi:hypothetical protein
MPLLERKSLLPLSHLQIILINLCPPTCIGKMRLKDSTQPKTGLEGLKYDSIKKGNIASQTGKYGF